MRVLVVVYAPWVDAVCVAYTRWEQVLDVDLVLAQAYDEAPNC